MQTTNVRGVDLAHELAGGESGGGGDGGDGGALPLVWGHGLTSSVGREDVFGLVDWPTVRRTTAVLRYDARGHGESGSTADPQGYHWRELALDQLALADAVGIDRYIAGGASMGCATALHVALLAPGRIEALMLAIPPTAWESRAAQQGNYELTAQLVEAGEIDLLVEGSRAPPPPDPLADIPQWRDGSELTLRTTDPQRLARIFRGAAVADLPPPAEVATLRLPTLILAWTGDAGHPMTTATRLVELMPHADLVVASTLEDLLGWTDVAVEFLANFSG